MGLFDWLGFGHSVASAPSDLERAIVLSVASVLPEELAEKLRVQVDALTHATREGNHVTLEQRDGRTVLTPTETALTDYDGRQRLASVETLSLHGPSRLHATIMMTNGNVSGIEYDHSPAEADPTRITEFHPRLLGPPFSDPDMQVPNGQIGRTA